MDSWQACLLNQRVVIVGRMLHSRFIRSLEKATWATGAKAFRKTFSKRNPLSARLGCSRKGKTMNQAFLLDNRKSVY